MDTRRFPRFTGRRAAVVVAALAVSAAVGGPLAGAQENLGDNGPEDTYFTYGFAAGQKLSTRMPVSVGTVAGPQTPDADMEFSSSVYAVTLSYGIERPSGRLKSVLIARTDAGEAGATQTVQATLGRRQVAKLRAAARKAGKKSVFVVVEGPGGS